MAEEYPHVRYEDICNKIRNILMSLNRWSVNQNTLESVKIYVDASAPEFVRSLKVMCGEDDSPEYWKDQLDECKKYDLPISEYMVVCPINFGTEAKNMLIHSKELLEFEARPLIGINSRFDKLIISLRTAVSNDKGQLDKEQTSHSDVLDSFRLALKHFKVKKQETNNRPIMLFSE